MILFPPMLACQAGLSRRNKVKAEVLAKAGLSRRSEAQADAQIFSQTGELFFQMRRAFSSCETR
jgi:hypothetical protein